MVSLSLSLSLIFISSINAQTIRVLNNLEIASLDVDSPLLEYYDNKVDGHSSITYISIEDIIENQSKGKLNFSISDNSIPSSVLSAIDMEFIALNDYKWSGKSKDNNVSLIINKRNGEFSGTILYSYLDNLYRIFPVSVY